MFNYKSIILKNKILFSVTLLLATFFYIIFLSININLYKTSILVKNFQNTDFIKYNSALQANGCYQFNDNSNLIINQINSYCYSLEFQRLIRSEKNFHDFFNSYENSDLIKNYLKKSKTSPYKFFYKNFEKKYFEKGNNQIIEYSFYLPEDLKKINLLEDYLIFTFKELNKNYKEDLIKTIDILLNENNFKYKTSQKIYNDLTVRKDFLFNEKLPHPEIINYQNDIIINIKKDLIRNGFLVNLQYDILEKNKSNFLITKFHKLFFSFILGLLLSILLINLKNFIRKFKKLTL
jgi:hypothetical protein